MREAFADIASRLQKGRACVVATLIDARNASPAPIGTSIVVDTDGTFVGNIGAGCHEGDIVEAARSILDNGGVDRVLDFDLNDELLDGSACGASLAVAIWKPMKEFAAIAERIVAGNEAVTFSCGPRTISIAAKRRMVVVGATKLAAELTILAHACDFHVTIVDPRPAFSTGKRHPNADVMLTSWPQDALPLLCANADAVVVLAHDAKIDLPALRCALDSKVSYIGALGSRRAQRARRHALAEFGFSETSLDRVHGPVGLDVGGQTDAQIACSIVAETLSVLNARSGRPLTSLA